LVIAVFVVLIALLMWGLDSALLYGVGKLTGRGA
jgi:preprotein translocase subunit SecE